MNRAAFRRFEFFDVETISDDVATKLGCLPTCAIGESGMLIFGDNKGHVTFADRDFHISDHRHKIFKGEVLGLAYLFDPANSSRQFVFAIGDENRATEHTGSFGGENVDVNVHNMDTMIEMPPMYVIKVFATSDMSRPMHTMNATFNDAYFTSFAVSHDGCEIAVGYSNGRVMLFTGLFLKESSSQSRPAQPVVLHAQHFAPVSGLHFCELPTKTSSTEEKRMKLFVIMDTRIQEDERAQQSESQNNDLYMMNTDVEDITHAGILVFDTSYVFSNSAKTAIAYNPRSEPRGLDERGAAPLCTSFLRNTRELAVARNEALYTYTVEDRGGALAIFGEKLCMSSVGRYTLMVTIDEKQAMENMPLTPAIVSSLSTQKPRKPNVNIYDLKNKTICGTSRKFTLPANEKVLFVLSDSSIVYLITSSLHMIRFQEKDVNRKLDVLLHQVQPPLFSQAIQLAGEEQMDPTEIMKLYKMYGDHLYSQHEYEAAITQYCSTIGYIPPSYVIIKFLDPYRINELITYLEKIREKMLAGPDHITLLLSCYAKIKDEKRIAALLDVVYAHTRTLAIRKAEIGADAATDLNEKDVFDPSQAIKILTGAGFLDQALKVCVKYLQHDTYLHLQLTRQPPQFDEALGYLTFTVFVCPREDVLSFVSRYGRLFLDNRPHAFTQLLIKLCVGDVEGFLPLSTASSSSGTASSGSTHNANASKKTVSAVSNVSPLSVSHSSSESMATIWSSDFWRVLHTLLSSAQKQHTQASQHTTHAQSLSVVRLPQEPVILTEDVLGLFHTHQHLLLVFLDGVIASSQSMPSRTQTHTQTRLLAPLVWTTALELWLQKRQALWDELRRVQGEAVAEDETHAQDEVVQELTQRVNVLESTLTHYLDNASVSYDNAQLLLLCHLYDYPQGEKFLLERENCVELLLERTTSCEYARNREDMKEMLKLLKKYGNKEPEMCVQVLTYCVQRTLLPKESREGGVDSARRAVAEGAGDDDESVGERESQDDFSQDDEESSDEAKWDAVMDVLDFIERESVLSPSQVLSILSINSELPLHVVTSYVSNAFRELDESVSAAEGDVRSAATNLSTIVDSEVQSLRLKRVQERAQRKARIGYDDDDDDDDFEEELQNLQREKEKWLSIRKKQFKTAADHEHFYKELDNSTDGFATIASFFGRSLIEC